MKSAPALLRKFLIESFAALGMLAYPAFFLMERNKHLVRPRDFLCTTGLSVLAALLLLLCCLAFCRSVARASVLAALLGLMALAYGPLVAMGYSGSGRPGSGLVDLNFYLTEVLAAVPAAGLALLLALWCARGSERSLRAMLKLLNFFVLTLLILSGGPLAIFLLRQSLAPAPPLFAAQSLEINLPVGGKWRFPNFYYIILDSYGGEEVLKDLYSYSNSGFTSFLESKGFYVAHQSRSNYPRTILSLAASLNGGYVQDIVPPDSLSNLRLESLAALLQNNAVFHSLRRYGYRVASFASGLFESEFPEVEIYLEEKRLDNFFAMHAGQFQVPLLRNYISSYLHARQRESIDYIVSSLGEMHRFDGPLFVFGHIVCPHPPFVFDSSGRAVQLEKVFTLGDGTEYGDRDHYQGPYIEQLKYINSRIMSSVEQILANDKSGPVIIIQGDHGPGSQFSWKSYEESNIQERFSILNAYYIPGSDYSGFYQKLSPVNSFRMVFNQVFEQNFEALPDRSFYSTKFAPFSFREVTEELK